MERKEDIESRAKKGLWKPEEDVILKTYVETHGEGNWATVSSKSGLERSGRSCRLRWKNYLRPDIKRGEMSMEEQDLIIRMHKLLGNRWSLIAGRLPGRTDNKVKNYWNTHLSKRHPSGKRKTTDLYCSIQNESGFKNNKRNKGICQHSKSEPSPELERLESVAEEPDGEQSRAGASICVAEEPDGEQSRTGASICVADTMIWEPTNYYFGSPTPSTNNETFVFDDEPFMAYLESFLLYESTRQIEGEKSSQ